MEQLMGFIFALLAAALWGTQFVPMRLLGRPNPLQYHITTSAGIFIGSLAIAILLGSSLSPNPYGLFSGLIWGIGNVSTILAIERMGLAKGMSLILGLSIFTSFLWGAFFFREAVSSLLLAGTGIAMILVGLPLASVNREKRSKAGLSGIPYAAVAGLVFGAIFVPAKLGGVPAADFLFPMALGILMGAGVLFAVKVRKIIVPEVRNGLLSGGIWAAANIFGLSAISTLGIAVGYPLTQLALLFSVAWGLFFFGEVQERKTLTKILVGSIVIILGAFALALSKL